MFCPNDLWTVRGLYRATLDAWLASTKVRPLLQLRGSEDIQIVLLLTQWAFRMKSSFEEGGCWFAVLWHVAFLRLTRITVLISKRLSIKDWYMYNSCTCCHTVAGDYVDVFKPVEPFGTAFISTNLGVTFTCSSIVNSRGHPCPSIISFYTEGNRSWWYLKNKKQPALSKFLIDNIHSNIL